MLNLSIIKGLVFALTHRYPLYGLALGPAWFSVWVSSGAICWGKLVFSTFFRGSAEGYWPKASILEIMGKTYDEVLPDDSDDANRQLYYRVTLDGLTFLCVLVHAEGHKDKIVGLGFLAVFTGFEISQSGLEALNRNLHISVSELDDNASLLLFSFLEPKGAFDANRFSLILQAWHRDLVMTIKMIMPGASFAEALPVRALGRARRLANNLSGAAPQYDAPKFDDPLAYRPRQGADASFTANGQKAPPDSAAIIGRNKSISVDPQSHLASFIGLRHAQRQLCQTCEGRGSSGFPRRSCGECQGSGMTAPRG